jgi:hypothetical protein
MADEKADPPSANAQMPRVRRRAPTIELKAIEVAVEPPASSTADSTHSPSERENTAPPEYSTVPPAYETSATAPPPEPPEPPHPTQEPAWRSFVRRPVVEAGLAGGLVALIVFSLLWLGGMLSGTAENPFNQRLALIEARLGEMARRPPPPNPETRMMEELAARVGRLESAASPARGNNSTANLDQAIKPLQTAVDDLARRTEDNATAAREAGRQADAALVAADAARVAVERTNVEALSNRVAALESATKSLTDDVTKRMAAAGDKPLRAAVAAQALQAAVERGDPFAAELAAAKTVAPDVQALAPLEPFAANGLPSAATLARQLSEVTPAILKATAAPEPAGGFLERLQANAERLVRIRPIDEAPGDDPPAVVGRAQAKASRSDLTGAAAELNALPANLRAPAEDWIKKVEARTAAVNASRRLAADALASLGKSP